MTIRRGAAAAAALVCAAAAAACGFGPGPSAEGEATLTVTRNFGAERLAEETVVDPPASESVTRALDAVAEVETGYGGNFVESIDGVEGRVEDGRRSDWFFFVNGYWSPVGAGEARVRPGDRIWWDYREWEEAYRVPAVVGSWPAPFTRGFEGPRLPTRVECLGRAPECGVAAAALEREGVSVPVGGATGERPGGTLRVLVGPWSRVRRDRAAGLIDGGPGTSGVYARFERGPAGWQLAVLDPRGEEGRRLESGAGLVAAVRRGEREQTWIVTGTDRAGVRRAVELLDAEHLRDRYAVAVDDAGSALGVPATTGARE